MSSTPPVELDFLGVRRTASSSSIRGMKTSAIASIGTRQLRRVIVAAAPEPKTMTLFYNGAVAAFHVPQDKAEAILRMAAEVVATDDARGRGDTLVRNFVKDMPLTRTRSLQQFLHKRKERLARAGPYHLGAASKSFQVKEEAA